MDHERLTVSLEPFVVNEPRLVDRDIKEVTYQRVTFGAWW